jgi:hypothetical protein
MNPGDEVPPASWWNKLFDSTDRLRRLVVAAPLEMVQGRRGVLRATLPRPINVRLQGGGSGGVYPFVEVQPAANGGWTDLPGGRSGAAAVEYKLLANLPPGSVVPARVGWTGDVRFAFNRLGNPACQARLCITVSACQPRAGDTVTVTGPIGYSARGTTAASGQVCFSIPGPGTYNWTVTDPTYGTTTGSKVCACGDNFVSAGWTIVYVNVIGNCDCPDPTVTLTSSDNQTATCTSDDSTGCTCSMVVPSPAVAPWTVSASAPGYNTGTLTNQTVSPCQVYSIRLTEASPFCPGADYVRNPCGCCWSPPRATGRQGYCIPKTLFATFNGPHYIFGDLAGESITLTWDPTSTDGSDVTDDCTSPEGRLRPKCAIVWKSACLPLGIQGACCAMEFCCEQTEGFLAPTPKTYYDLYCRVTLTQYLGNLCGQENCNTTLRFDVFDNSGCSPGQTRICPDGQIWAWNADPQMPCYWTCDCGSSGSPNGYIGNVVGPGWSYNGLGAPVGTCVPAPGGPYYCDGTINGPVSITGSGPWDFRIGGGVPCPSPNGLVNPTVSFAITE